MSIAIGFALPRDISGNFTGNFAILGLPGRISWQEAAVPQRLFAQFPARIIREKILKNKEFLSGIREFESEISCRPTDAALGGLEADNSRRRWLPPVDVSNFGRAETDLYFGILGCRGSRRATGLRDGPSGRRPSNHTGQLDRRLPDVASAR